MIMDLKRDASLQNVKCLYLPVLSQLAKIKYKEEREIMFPKPPIIFRDNDFARKMYLIYYFFLKRFMQKL